MNKKTCFFAYFLEHVLLILSDNVDELKFSLRVLLSICLIFCQFQPGVAYKSIAYKKACISVGYYDNRDIKNGSFYHFC